MRITPNRSSFGADTFDFQAKSAWTGVALRENSISTAFVDKQEQSGSYTTPINKEVVPPSRQPVIDQTVDIDATVIQLWEGRVLEVDLQKEVMQVLLTAKLGQIPEHTAEIELQWVSDQDRDLVVAGAVFYLTLYKQTRRGSIRNSQELRFRRRPAWTKQQVQKIFTDADLILAKMKSRPIAA
jgi:hypothetical protein